jgi:hypothetical protein
MNSTANELEVRRNQLKAASAALKDSSNRYRGSFSADETPSCIICFSIAVFVWDSHQPHLNNKSQRVPRLSTVCCLVKNQRSESAYVPHLVL